MQVAGIGGSPPGPALGAAAAADDGACATASEALGTARGLLHQLRASHAEAAAAAEAHRREREGLLHQLQAIQSRYAGLQDFIWQLDTTQLDAEGLEAASDAAAAAAEAAALTSSALGGLSGDISAVGSGPLLPSGLLPRPASSGNPAAAQQLLPPAGPFAAVASLSWQGSNLASSTEEATLAACQHDVAALLMEVQRTQQERDALLYRLDQLEQHIREQQAQQGEGHSTSVAAAPGAVSSPGASVGSSGSSPTHVAQTSLPARLPSRRRQPATAGERALASLQDLSSLVDDAAAAGALTGSAAAQLRQQCAELQAQVYSLSDQAAASAAAADQLQDLLAAERAERGGLQQRLAGAQRRQRAARQEQLLLRQHVGELEDLVHAAIGEAEGAREMLEKVTAEGAGGKLKLGEVWTQLLESQQRASVALRSPPTAAAAAVPDSQSAVAAWQLLENATGGGKLPSPSRQQSSGLRDRLAALSRRYSSTTLEQAEAAAAAETSTQGPAGAEEASPADVVEAAEEEAEASLMAAAAVAAGSAGSFATPARSAGSTQAGGETPTHLGSAGNALGPSPAALSPAAPALDLASGSRPEGQPVDVAEQMDAILADLQQRLSSLEAAAAAAAATSGAAAAVPRQDAQRAAAAAVAGAEAQRQAGSCADAATQTAPLEPPAAQDVCFHALLPPGETDAPTSRPSSYAPARAGASGWLAVMQPICALCTYALTLLLLLASRLVVQPAAAAAAAASSSAAFTLQLVWQLALMPVLLLSKGPKLAPAARC